MNVILIGAGRYGNHLVGRKYIDGEINGYLIGVVDPNIDKIKKQPDYTLKDTPTYRSIEEIPCDVFDKKTVAELAIVPKIIPDNFLTLAKKGIKNIILPKPVTSDSDSFQKMKDAAKKYDIKTAVASNWHYSTIVNISKAIIDKTKGKKVSVPPEYKKELDKTLSDIGIKKIEIDYNKQNEVLTIDPPSQELPHALQIVYSTGLTDFKNVKMSLDPKKQSKSRVNVKIEDKKSKIEGGILINSDLNMGDKLTRQRERLLKIYLDDEDRAPDIVIDYDAKFTPSGKCIKHPYIKYDVTKDGKRVHWEKEITEDNMNVMYDKIFGYFNGDKSATRTALTLDRYTPISNCICNVQKMWENIVKKNND